MSDLPILDALEQRILGVLLEKEKTTPDYYPMTVNGIMNACNQKSARNPVMQVDESMVQIGIDTLRGKGLVNTVVGGGSRTVKYKHHASVNLDLELNEEAILCLILLRGPLTAGEVKSNSGRLYEFANLESVQNGMHGLTSKESPILQPLPKKPGQKETRYMHLLGGEINVDDFLDDKMERTVPVSNYEQRLAALENEVAELKEIIFTLRSTFLD